MLHGSSLAPHASRLVLVHRVRQKTRVNSKPFALLAGFGEDHAEDRSMLTYRVLAELFAEKGSIPMSDDLKYEVSRT